jgi:hypothetical protein
VPCDQENKKKLRTEEEKLLSPKSLNFGPQQLFCSAISCACNQME